MKLFNNSIPERNLMAHQFFFTNTCQRVDPISTVLHLTHSTLFLFFFHSLVCSLLCSLAPSLFRFFVFSFFRFLTSRSFAPSLLRFFVFSLSRFLASQQKQTWKMKKKWATPLIYSSRYGCTVHILKMASNNSTVKRVVKWRQFKITQRDTALFHDNYHNYYRQSIFSS